MALRVKLTEEGLFVNKYRCKSVTIVQTKERYEATLFHIAGITKKIPKLNRFGKQDVDTITQTPLWTTLKLKKKICSDKLEYSGIELSNGECNHAVNSFGDYVNFYPLQEETEVKFL